MRSLCLAGMLAAALMAACWSCSTGSPEQQEERSSALKDYIVKPLEKANDAKAQVENRYRQKKKEWDRLDD